ncbi:uncharacterized protein LOC126330056 [Schistocerca gregaria]|uniref:uncharacterized protein LOC126330056 n=1 Tax=Schistocerca gregaria TaxID=7010 RepID=UPI00211EDFA9|nr:uncharacterized protein LOC126330056 [Schistocerca gregaria]
MPHEKCYIPYPYTKPWFFSNLWAQRARYATSFKLESCTVQTSRFWIRPAMFSLSRSSNLVKCDVHTLPNAPHPFARSDPPSSCKNNGPDLFDELRSINQKYRAQIHTMETWLKESKQDFDALESDHLTLLTQFKQAKKLFYQKSLETLELQARLSKIVCRCQEAKAFSCDRQIYQQPKDGHSKSQVQAPMSVHNSMDCIKFSEARLAEKLEAEDAQLESPTSILTQPYHERDEKRDWLEKCLIESQLTLAQTKKAFEESVKKVSMLQNALLEAMLEIAKLRRQLSLPEMPSLLVSPLNIKTASCSDQTSECSFNLLSTDKTASANLRFEPYRKIQKLIGHQMHIPTANSKDICTNTPEAQNTYLQIISIYHFITALFETLGFNQNEIPLLESTLSKRTPLTDSIIFVDKPNQLFQKDQAIPHFFPLFFHRSQFNSENVPKSLKNSVRSKRAQKDCATANFDIHSPSIKNQNAFVRHTCWHDRHSNTNQNLASCSKTPFLAEVISIYRHVLTPQLAFSEQKSDPLHNTSRPIKNRQEFHFRCLRLLLVLKYFQNFEKSVLENYQTLQFHHGHSFIRVYSCLFGCIVALIMMFFATFSGSMWSAMNTNNRYCS